MRSLLIRFRIMLNRSGVHSYGLLVSLFLVLINVACWWSRQSYCSDTSVDSLLASEIRFARGIIEWRERMGIGVKRWGRYDESGDPTGLWFSVYEDTPVLRAIGYFWEGFPDSVWIWFDRYGRKRVIMNFVNLDSFRGNCFLHRYVLTWEGNDSLYGLCNGRNEVFVWIVFEGRRVVEAVNLHENMYVFTAIVDSAMGIGDSALFVKGARLRVAIYPPRPRCFEVRSWIRVEGYTDWEELVLPEDPYSPVRFELDLEKEGEYLLIQKSEFKSDFYSFSYVGYDTTWIYVFPSSDSLYRFLQLVRLAREGGS